MKLLTVDSVEAAAEKLCARLDRLGLVIENIAFDQATGRVLARDVHAPEDIPGFLRSTVDGYAVLAKDTAAASETIPVFLTLAGRVEMGRSAGFAIGPGQCAQVPTGGEIPGGADCAVMLEYCETPGGNQIAVYAGAAPGENLVYPGDDAKKGEVLLTRGTKLLPQHIGALAAAGITEISVYAPLKCAVISTGDELVHPREALRPGQVHDVNTYALRTAAESAGLRVTDTLALPDNRSALENALRPLLAENDILFISGGSSQGEKDATHDVIDGLSAGGVFTHGLAMKPGKPTILGWDADGKTLLCGLPGHPVAALLVFEVLFAPLLRRLAGTPERPAIPAALETNVAAAPGKTTCFPARLTQRGTQLYAAPVFGKSGLISTLTRAEGYFVLERGREGANAGETVHVHLF